MKLAKTTLMKGLIVVAAALSLTACDDDDDNYYYDDAVPNAIVTLKTNPSDGTFYMQLDDSTTLLPTNMKTSPFGNKEVRALTNFKYDKEITGHSRLQVYVNWVDSIRTKAMAPDLGDKNEATYGNDPVEIVNDWTTVFEDGYLTLRFRTRFAGNKPHILNLVKGKEPNEVVLYHSANGDGLDGRPADGLIAFKLDPTVLENLKDGKLTLKWNSYSGEKSVTFKSGR